MDTARCTYLKMCVAGKDSIDFFLGTRHHNVEQVFEVLLDLGGFVHLRISR